MVAAEEVSLHVLNGNSSIPRTLLQLILAATGQLSFALASGFCKNWTSRVESVGTLSVNI